MGLEKIKWSAQGGRVAFVLQASRMRGLRSGTTLTAQAPRSYSTVVLSSG